jgi:hypothetical protein
MNCQVYMFIRRLMSSTSIKEWKQTIESSRSENLWEARANECKAIANFAINHDRNPNDVTLAEVVDSSIGLAGWVAVVPVGISPGVAGKAAGGKSAGRGARTAAAPMPLADGEVPRQPKRGAPKAAGGNPLIKAERDAKELLSKLAALNNDRLRLQAQCDKEPDAMSWALKFLNTMNEMETEMQQPSEDLGDFVSDFKAHALSPTGMRTLKKTYVHNYLEKLIQFKAFFVDKANRLDEVVTTVRNMLSASEGLAQPSKRKPSAATSSGSAKKARPAST